MKTKNPVGIIDLRHQPEHITPKKFQLFQDYSANTNNARLFLVLFTRRKIKLIQTVIN